MSPRMVTQRVSVEGIHVSSAAQARAGAGVKALVGPAGRQARAGADGLRDQGVNLVPLPLVDDRAEGDLTGGRVADREVRRLLGQGLG